LEDDGHGGLKPAGELAEELIVRPTSETIIGASFSKWINSYRDLPLLINQWANVVRWEMRTRIFLRTTEFLWQEGHTVHSTEQEALDETYLILNLYAEFAEKYLAIPVIKGEKTEAERFPGAVKTFCIEAMMQDRKALQAGTSHFLGRNFAKASDIKFQNKEGKEEFAWTTSWGVSTRLVGALIMAHSDDDGLILPPRIAPSHIAVIPIYRNEDEQKLVMDFISKLQNKIKKIRYNENKIRIEIDNRELRGGEKVWHWIKKGIPIRLEIGPRDIQNNSVFMGRRDLGIKEKNSMDVEEFVNSIPEILTDIQDNILKKAVINLKDHTVKIDNREEFYEYFTPQNKDNPEIHGGFTLSHWCGNSKCEEKIKDDLKVTIRCIPIEAEEEKGKCICCDEESTRRVIFSKNY